MPQPSLDIHKYLDHTLPHLYEKYPPGTGGTGARTNWPEGTIKAIEVVPNFAHLAKDCKWSRGQHGQRVRVDNGE